MQNMTRFIFLIALLVYVNASKSKPGPSQKKPENEGPRPVTADDVKKRLDGKKYASFTFVGEKFNMDPYTLSQAFSKESCSDVISAEDFANYLNKNIKS